MEKLGTWVTLALLLLSSLTMPTMANESPGTSPSTCGGFAPINTTCSTGLHRTGWLVFHGVADPPCATSTAPGAIDNPCFAGIVESKVVGLGSNYEHIISCEIVAIPGLVSRSCVQEGLVPVVDEVLHECRTYWPQPVGNAAAGGVGEWACFIY